MLPVLGSSYSRTTLVAVRIPSLQATPSASSAYHTPNNRLAPASKGTRWVVKNTLELKSAERVLWQSQRADGSWECAGHMGPWLTAQTMIALRSDG